MDETIDADESLPPSLDGYRIEKKLAAGGQAETFLAEEEHTGRQVCLKRVRIDQVDDWKSVELFERETETLERLDHPSIPEFVDAFHETDDDGAKQFILAQEFVDGTDLQQLIEQGTRFTEAKIRRLAAEILEVLEVIHGKNPPVIHRDIKPSNIMQRDDGSFALIDFGTVRLAIPDPTDTSTTVGTTGYSPLEQLRGRVQPASDLYALGTTLIHLASRVHPAELPLRSNCIQFRDRVNLEDGFADFIDRLIQPDPSNRYVSARAARRALERLKLAEKTPENTADERQNHPPNEKDNTKFSCLRVVLLVILGFPILGSGFLFLTDTMGTGPSTALNGCSLLSFPVILWWGWFHFRRRPEQ